MIQSNFLHVTASLHIFQPIFFSGKCHAFKVTCFLKLPCKPAVGEFIEIFLDLPSDHEVYGGDPEILVRESVVARVDRISMLARTSRDEESLGHPMISFESDLALAPPCADIKYAQQALEALLQGLGVDWKYKKSTDRQFKINAENLMLRGMWDEFSDMFFESEMEGENREGWRIPKLTAKGAIDYSDAMHIFRQHKFKNPTMPSPPRRW